VYPHQTAGDRSSCVYHIYMEYAVSQMSSKEPLLTR